MRSFDGDMGDIDFSEIDYVVLEARICNHKYGGERCNQACKKKVMVGRCFDTETKFGKLCRCSDPSIL